MTSQWVGDIVIDTKQSGRQQTGSFTQDLEKPGSVTQDPDVMITWKLSFKN